MNSAIYPENDANQEIPAVLYADGEYLTIVAPSFEAAEATTVPIKQLERGPDLHRLHSGCHVEVSLSNHKRVHGQIRVASGGGYELEVCCELEESVASAAPGEADHTTADIIRKQLVELLYEREQLHVAMALDEPYAGPGASEDCAHYNGAITALCELALKAGLHQAVAAADLQAIASLREAARESLEEIPPPEGELEDITFARAVLRYLDGDKIEPR